ncbi:MAG: hypothetical protein ACYCO3_04955 [Mycobacteriales bacterium]
MDSLEIIRQLEGDPGLRAQLRAVLLGDEFLELPMLVQRLAAAQARTDASVQRLTEAQARTDASVQRLTEAQARTEAAVQRLTDAQARTDATLDRLQTALGRLSEVVGGTVEADAVALLEWLAGERGWVIRESPAPIEVDGEIDVVATLADGKRTFRILAEAKTRLRVADVTRFAAALPTLAAAVGVHGPYLAYVYGLRVYPGVDAAASKAGLGVLDSRGERVVAREKAA